MTITTKYEPGQIVRHVTQPDGDTGIITAFMVRGQNHSYQVSWGPKEDIWSLEYELIPAPDRREIGIWRSQPS